MNICNNNSYKKNENGTFIALGSFDGIHLGHLSLIEKIVELAKDNNAESVVYTFLEHPRKFLCGEDSVKLLTNYETKCNIMNSYDVDCIFFEDFNEEYMKKSPEQFVEYLSNKFNVKGIVVGFNYKFGHKNKGDIRILERLQEVYNYKLYVMKPFKFQDKAISSTRIRDEINKGKIENANCMLGRIYMLEGEVVHGRQIGRKIGFPTANMKYDTNMIIPKDGVYYTNVCVNNKVYRGITSIGFNPTVNGEKMTIETNILDFNKDIYGQNIKVYFVKKIRDNKKFDSIEQLKEELTRNKNSSAKEKIFI